MMSATFKKFDGDKIMDKEELHPGPPPVPTPGEKTRIHVTTSGLKS